MTPTEKKTSVFANTLIWFGAAISIAEILTGVLIAPLGFAKGMAAILIGHLIGGSLMFLAGLIGAKTGKSAMETVKLSFGQRGALLFAALNVLQLLGWTAVMIKSAASAAIVSVNETRLYLPNAVTGNPLWESTWVWSLIIGALIIVWLLVGIRNLRVINIFVMASLFVLCLVLSLVIFKDVLGLSGLFSRGNFNIANPAMGAIGIDGNIISFGAAVEISAAMPLSWLPLLSDYTRLAKKPLAGTGASCITYFVVSCWMYIIGMGAALLTGESDVARIMSAAGLGIAALITIVFSTVTTTFLDAHSAGVSSQSIAVKLREKPMAISTCAAGMALAIFTPISQYENFLYLIGSVFAPMSAILISDYYVLKKNHFQRNVAWVNMLIWIVGFAVYRFMLHLDTPLGNTLPSMLVTLIISIIVAKIRSDRH
ncbi:hydrogenase expression protein [Clostridia bacterium]|nr:hydrogenase expression protein [Clostridia bacterium]